MKKMITMLLLLAMMLSAFAGCSDTTNEEVPANDPAADAELAESAEIEEETMYLPDDLPADLSYDGTTVTTFGWSGPVLVEFYVEEQNGEVVNDAIFARNMAVEERLGITLEYHLEPGAYDQRNTWVQALSSSITAGDGAYDISAGYSMAGASLASKGMCISLNDCRTSILTSRGGRRPF